LTKFIHGLTKQRFHFRKCNDFVDAHASHTCHHSSSSSWTASHRSTPNPRIRHWHCHSHQSRR